MYVYGGGWGSAMVMVGVAVTIHFVNNDVKLCGCSSIPFKCYYV